MAVRTSSNRQTAEEEAEVDVLKSRLESTAQIQRKIEARLGEVMITGKSLDDAAKPLNGAIESPQKLLQNIQAALGALERMNKQADSKNDEEKIIRMGPEKAGLTQYINSLKRLHKTLNAMKTSNLRSTQDTVAEVQRLINSGNTQLESYCDKVLRSDTPRSIEPLRYVTKNEPFPILSEDTISKFSFLNDHIAKVHRETGLGGESPSAKIYAEIRGQYIQYTLANLASASVTTAKKKDPTAIYRAGMSGIGIYAQAIEAMLRVEYENICRVFARQDWGTLLLSTSQGAITELGRVLRELNVHIRQHLATDCFLAYETVEVITVLANSLGQATGEMKVPLTTAIRPIKDTAKSSLAELLETMKQKINVMQALPTDGAPVPIVSESVRSLQGMVAFLRPISNIMMSIGDGGWRSVSAARGARDATPIISSFDVGADGKEMFAHYCTDTIEALFECLEKRARLLLGKKSVIGVFMANNITIVERMVVESELGPLLEQRLSATIDVWRKKAKTLYMDTTREVSVHLLDTIHTSRAQRPTSGSSAADSASIMKALSSRDRDNIKSKFTAFNSSFDEMIRNHKAYNMEPEVRRMFARDMQQTVEPLYNRFFDRYHEIDKGKGKYVKYDKATMSGVFRALY